MHGRGWMEVIHPLIGAATIDTAGGGHGARGRETGAGGGRETAVRGGGGIQPRSWRPNWGMHAAERAVRMLIRAANGAGGGAPRRRCATSTDNCSRNGGRTRALRLRLAE
jgi:hypothetical protein